MKKLLFIFSLTLIATLSCNNMRELSIEEIAQAKTTNNGKNAIISQCKIKLGNKKEIGKAGGFWHARISQDPMTFNTLTARDWDSRQPLKWLYESTLDYDPFTKKWKGSLLTYKIENQADGTQKVICKLKDNLVWYIPKTKKAVPITSDDLLFWMQEVEGDPLVQHPGYAGQFVTMEDGSEKQITITKIDDKNFFYTLPRISADPLLEIGATFGPRFIFEKVKNETFEKSYKKAISKGKNEEEAKKIASGEAASAMNSIQSIANDPLELPTMGAFYIESYQPGIKVTLKRNPYYHKKDEKGNQLPYIDGIIYHIIREDESTILEFKEGKLDSIGIGDITKLKGLLKIKESKKFDIYYGGASLGSSFITINQNPKGLSPLKISWFSKKEFRQAISCLINREEIISQIYLGFGEPNNYLFCKANSMYNPDIKLQYQYNPQKAMELLNSIGMRQDKEGILKDSEGNRVEFDFTYGSGNTLTENIVSIIIDNLNVSGMKVNQKATDFQKIVDGLLKTYDWDMTTVGLGANYWPTGGSNVWLSSGNFHLWNPNQKEPATEWEAEIDALYNKGRFASSPKKAKKSWDKYQKLILEQVPLIYLPYTYKFRAFSSRWANINYDLLDGFDEGTDLLYIYLN